MEVDEEEVTARDPKVARRPLKATQAMILANELHHADYRDWCDHCRAGRGVPHQHKSSSNDNEDAEFSIDYAFMAKEASFELERNMSEPEQIGAAPILVGCDHRSRVLKSDQEELIIALKKAVAIKRQGPTLNI